LRRLFDEVLGVWIGFEVDEVLDVCPVFRDGSRFKVDEVLGVCPAFEVGAFWAGLAVGACAVLGAGTDRVLASIWALSLWRCRWYASSFLVRPFCLDSQIRRRAVHFDSHSGCWRSNSSSSSRSAGEASPERYRPASKMNLSSCIR